MFALMFTNGFQVLSPQKNIKHMLMKTTEKIYNNKALGQRVQNLQTPPALRNCLSLAMRRQVSEAVETISSMASRMAPAHSSPCAKTLNALADSLPRIFIKVVFVALAAQCAIPRLCVK